MPVWTKVQGVNGGGNYTTRNNVKELSLAEFSTNNNTLTSIAYNAGFYTASYVSGSKRISEIFCLPRACVIKYDDGTFKFSGYPYYQRMQNTGVNNTGDAIQPDTYYPNANSVMAGLNANTSNFVGILSNVSFISSSSTNPTAANNTPVTPFYPMNTTTLTPPNSQFNYTFKTGNALVLFNTVDSGNSKQYNYIARCNKLKSVYFNPLGYAGNTTNPSTANSVNNYAACSLYGLIDFGNYAPALTFDGNGNCLTTGSSFIDMMNTYEGTSSSNYNDPYKTDLRCLSIYRNQEYSQSISGSATNKTYRGYGFLYSEKNNKIKLDFDFKTLDGFFISAFYRVNKDIDTNTACNFSYNSICTLNQWDNGTDYNAVYDPFSNGNYTYSNIGDDSIARFLTGYSGDSLTNLLTSYYSSTTSTVNSNNTELPATANATDGSQTGTTLGNSLTGNRPDIIFTNTYSRNIFTWTKPNNNTNYNRIFCFNRMYYYKDAYSTGGTGGTGLTPDKTGTALSLSGITNCTVGPGSATSTFYPVDIKSSHYATFMIYKRNIYDNYNLLAACGEKVSTGQGTTAANYQTTFATVSGNISATTFTLPLSSTTTISINSVLEIAAGKQHHLLLINDGSSTPKVLSIGRNTFGQLGNGTTTSSSGYFNLLDLSSFGTPIHVDCGEFYSIIVFQNGQIAMFGDNTFGQCGVNSTNSQIKVPTLSIGY